MSQQSPGWEAERPTGAAHSARPADPRDPADREASTRRSRFRRRLAVVVAVVVAALVVASVLSVRRDLDREPFGYAGRTQVTGMGQYRPLFGGQAVWVVNRPVGEVVTYALTLANRTGQSVTVTDVGPLFPTIDDAPAATVRVFDGSGQPGAQRPAAGAEVPAGARFDLILHTLGQGCLKPAFSTTVRTVRLGTRRLGADRTREFPLPQPVLVTGPTNGDPAAAGPCGVPRG